MIILQDFASTLVGLLKDQRLQEGESYRLMHFVIQCFVKEGLLLYNVLTRAVVLLSPEEALKMASNPTSVPELIAKWFAVPEAHDDRKLAHEVRAVGKMLEKRPKGFSRYTILTTTDCNARCFYCYEKGRKRIPMKDETAMKVVGFILRNNPGKKIYLRWFGGEPLFNKKVITFICGRLHDAGVEFQSSMISNGYLFDEETIADAIDLWNLKKVQITLDGTENVYNQRKAFIYSEGSAYRRVLENIHRLLTVGIRVTVRLNIDRHNGGDILDLVDILASEFRGQKQFSVYSHSLFGVGSEDSVVSHSDAYRQEVFEVRKQLQQRLQESGIALVEKLPSELKLNRCMADSNNSVIILSDGHLGKCEHYSEDHSFGHLDTMEKDEAVLNDFKQLREEADACTECPFYPECYRLVLCEEAVHCYPEEREEKLIRVRQSLLRFYQKKKDEVSD